MKHLSPVIFHLLLIGVVTAGYLYGVDGAANLMRFFVCMLIALGFFGLCNDKQIKEMAKTCERRPVWVASFAIGARTLIVVVMVWNGAWWTAIGYTTALFLWGAMNLAIERERGVLAQQASDAADAAVRT